MIPVIKIPSWIDKFYHSKKALPYQKAHCIKLCGRESSSEL